MRVSRKTNTCTIVEIWKMANEILTREWITTVAYKWLYTKWDSKCAWNTLRHQQTERIQWMLFSKLPTRTFNSALSFVWNQNRNIKNTVFIVFCVCVCVGWVQIQKITFSLHG